MTTNNTDMETQISLNIVHGGFILTSPGEDGNYRTEVFTSQGKLMKAVRTAVDAFSLVKKEKAEPTDEE
jgi:hypothetical protein